jgi:hypothetical protein
MDSFDAPSIEHSIIFHGNGKKLHCELDGNNPSPPYNHEVMEKPHEESKNQICVEEGVEHMILHDDFKIGEEHKKVEDKSTTLDQLHEDIRVDGEVGHLHSGGATSVLATHEEDTMQWNDIITDLFEDSSIMSQRSHEIRVLDHEKDHDTVESNDGSLTSIDRHEEIKHKRTDFVYFA